MATATKKKPVAQNKTTLAIGATAGLVAGLAANAVRKAIVQAPTIAAGSWEDALAAEHKMVLALFDKLEQTSEKQKAKRTMLLTQIKHALAKHALQEENAIYAALRDHDQTDAADHLNHEHGYVKQYLYDLTIMPRDHAGWLPKVREFRALVAKHAREEEEEIFPKMRSQLSDEENKQLTIAMNREGLKLA